MSWALAIDPGKITGWAQLRDGVFTSGEEECFEFNCKAECTVGVVDQVICENFVITQSTVKKAQGDLWSLKSIGLFEYWCARQETPLKLQLPANAKSFSTDKKLRELGWYAPSKGGHKNDAARHLLLWLASEGFYDGEKVTYT